jgi:ferrous iron transport protein B
MFLLVYVVAGPAVGFLEGILDYVTKRIVHHMIQHNVPALLQSFVTNSILGGVGAVVVFFPNMFVLFFLLSALEDSGYLARGTFIIDRLMYMLGLGGKSFIPIVMGFGCSVPAMVGTRILSNRRDRLLTMLVIPFISCSAKLPVFILFANTLFGDRAAAVVFSLYVLGLLMMIVVTKVLSMTVFKNSESILMMELPVYHLPIFRNVLRITWRDASEFVKKASTFIMLTVFFVWLLSSFPLGVEYASRESYLGMIGSTISPMFAWAGYGFWQAGIALMTGFLAKEAIIGTLGALFGGAEDTLSVVLGKLFTPLSAYSYLIMILFYTPCLTAVATFYRESRSSRWTLFFVSYTFLFGWIMSILVYQVGKMF